MKSGFKISQVTIILLIFISGWSNEGNLLSQSSQRPSRQSSVEAFSNGKYEEAYIQFRDLLKIYPRDPLYKYYSGVCLVELKRDPETAAALLQESLKEPASMRTLPSDVVYYLGRARHMSGRYSEAIDAYRQYEDQAGRKLAKEKGIEELIQQCLNENGKLPSLENKVLANVPVTAPGQAVTSVPVPENQPAVKTEVKQPLPSAYEKLLEEALKLQFKADSLKEFAAVKRQGLGSLQPADKEAQKKFISETDMLAASFQKRADQKFNDANIIKSGGSLPLNAAAPEKKEYTPKNDTVRSLTVTKPSPAIKPSPVTTQKEKTGIFSVFELLPKPPQGKIEIDPDVPEGLVYRIQLAVFRNPVTPAVFKGITPVYGFRVTPNGLTYYYAGMFRRSSDASKALITVKSKGFKDSFVVPFAGKKPVSAERGAIMEKEWGSVPLFKEEVKSDEAVDTLPPTLVFRVEVARSKKALDEKKTEELRKIAGNRGLDILSAEDGSKAYLIGKFITFESAAEYNDILVRNGYRDSKVTAWIGKKEIPVETARRLFEKIE